MLNDKSKIFISYSWEDKIVARRVEYKLESAGVDMWVDHSKIRGGESFPKRINDALEWCNILLLLWSKSAKQSIWVHREWENAMVLNKVIIPCLLDDTKLPALLTSIAYLDFRDFYKGIGQLLQVLDLIKTNPHLNGEDLVTLIFLDKWDSHLDECDKCQEIYRKQRE